MKKVFKQILLLTCCLFVLTVSGTHVSGGYQLNDFKDIPREPIQE